MELDVKSTKNRSIIDFRKVGYDDLCVLGRYKYNKAEQNLKEHVHHEMIEICYCDKGSQIFVVNNQKYLVKGGDVFIHFPGEKHGSGGYPEEKGCLYWLIIKTNNEAKTADGSCPNVAFLLEQLINKNIRHFRGGKEVKSILESIFEKFAATENSEIKRIQTELLIQSLLLNLYKRVSSSNTKAIDDRLNIVINFISNNLTEPISIELLAKSINLSSSRFKNWFKEQTGFTPIDFIQRQRISQAIKMIQNHPEISLTEIAYTFNFSTPQYFSTVMKKYTGETPSQIKAEKK